jgi:hypothetical protein
MLIKKNGAEASQDARDQARLKTDKEIGSQQKLKPNLKSKLKIKWAKEIKNIKKLKPNKESRAKGIKWADELRNNKKKTKADQGVRS